MSWYEWFFSGLGVRTLEAFTLRFAPRVGEYCTLLTREQVIRTFGTVERRIRTAKQSLCFSGCDCKFVAESCSDEIESAIKRNVSVRALCVDPASPAASMVSRIDPRFPDEQSFIDSMASVQSVLDRLARQHSGKFQYKLLPILPAQGFFIVDPLERTGMVKVELYTAQPYMPANLRPHFAVSQRSKMWRAYFLQQWENYWGLGRDPLRISDNNVS